MRAASYIRMSTAHQDASPGQQRAEILKRANQEGLELVEEYADLGISGDKTEKRVEFQKMVEDGVAGKFDSVVCYSQDRLGRYDLIDAGRWLYPLRDAGVRVLTADAGWLDFDSLPGQLSFMAVQLGKSQFLRDQARNVKRGQLAHAEKGCWTFGSVPEGYEYSIKGKASPLVPDPQTGPIITKLFEKFATGELSSLKAGVDWLWQQGIGGRSGDKPLTVNGLSKMMKNTVYLGHIYGNRQSKSKYLNPGNGRAKLVENPPDKWVVSLNAHEPLTDSKTFARVEEQFSRRTFGKCGGKKTNGIFPLKGLVKCFHCSEPMQGSFEKEKGRWLVCCGGYVRQTTDCPRRIVPLHDVLSIVLGELVRVLSPIAEEVKNTLLDAAGGHFIDLVERKKKSEPVATRTALDEMMRAVNRQAVGPGGEFGFTKSVASAYQKLLDSPPKLDIDRIKKFEQAIADKKLEIQGAETRLLEVSNDMIPRIEKQVRKLENERQTLETDLANYRDSAKSDSVLRETCRLLEAATTLASLQDAYEILGSDTKENAIEQLRGRQEQIRELLLSYNTSITLGVHRPKGKRVTCEIMGGIVEMSIPGVSSELLEFLGVSDSFVQSTTDFRSSHNGRSTRDTENAPANFVIRWGKVA